MKRLILFFAFCSVILSVKLLAQHPVPRNYKLEMLKLYHSLERRYYDSVSGFYRQHAVKHADDRKVSYLWPVCALFQAYYETDKVLNEQMRYQALLPLIAAYRDTAAPATGYASYPPAFGGGARFYDDNLWLGITAMDHYLLYGHKTGLQMGREIFRFVMTGYDTVTGGGLYWEEKSYATKNACSNAPAIVLALQLARATGKKQYLDTALLLYNWVNRHLKAPGGLYYDNIAVADRKTDRRLYSYNTGCMLQSDVYLYQITHDSTYLKNAIALAEASVKYFLGGGHFRDNYWFSAVLLRGLVQLSAVYANPAYLEAFKLCVEDALQHNQRKEATMGLSKEQDLVAQGGMLEILAQYAWLEEHKNIVKTKETDIVIYGATAAGVTAAVQAARMHKNVVLISNNAHVGGLSSSGLGGGDVNNYKAIGGLSKLFFETVYNHYQDSGSWRNTTRSEYFKQGGLIWNGRSETAKMQWMFEPAVAERIFLSMLYEAGVQIVYNERLLLNKGVIKKGKNIKTIVMGSGRRFSGRQFIDATYEGDLMAGAGVSYIVGRESNSVYQENRNGIIYNDVLGKNGVSIDAWRIPGNKESGLLPFIEPAPPGAGGEGDHRTQAYCYRFTLSTDTAYSVPLFRPAGYDSLLYEMLARKIALNPNIRLSDILTLTPIPNRKTDTNHGDLPGANYEWPDGDYTKREKIAQLHRLYTQGLVWFCSHDARVPSEIRKEMSRYGWATDEFEDNNNFPPLLYVREARRMKSDYVMTEHDYFGRRTVTDPVGLATYRLDTHTVTHFLDDSGRVRSEGVPPKIPAQPYAISYRAIRPPAKECTNLLVPGCLSSSHSAYSSIRMEPVFMIVGQSAGAAAALAIDSRVNIQDVPYQQLKTVLLKEGQLLSKESIK